MDLCLFSYYRVIAFKCSFSSSSSNLLAFLPVFSSYQQRERLKVDTNRSIFPLSWLQQSNRRASYSFIHLDSEACAQLTATISRQSLGQYFSLISGICSCETLQTQIVVGVSLSISILGAQTLPSPSYFYKSILCIYPFINSRYFYKSSILNLAFVFYSQDSISKSQLFILYNNAFNWVCYRQVNLSYTLFLFSSAILLRYYIQLQILLCFYILFYFIFCLTSFYRTKPPFFQAYAKALQSEVAGLSSKNSRAGTVLMVSFLQLGTDRGNVVFCKERTVREAIIGKSSQQYLLSNIMSQLELISKQVSVLHREPMAFKDSQVQNLLLASLS